MSEQKNILYLEKNFVAYITFDRPEKHNAFNEAMIKEFQELLNYVEKRKHIRALILSGNGTNFSAGADLTWMKKIAGYSLKENEADAKNLADLLEKINE